MAIKDMDIYIRKTIHYISLISLACSIGGIFSVVLFVLAPFGHLVISAIYLFKAGLVLGIVSALAIFITRKELVCLVFSIIAIILAVPASYLDYMMERSVKARQEAEKAFSGEYNLRLLGMELTKYAKDHDGYLPVADKWCDQLMIHNKNLTKENFIHPMFDDPKLNLKGECHFAFNKNLSRMKLSDLPDDVVFCSGDLRLRPRDMAKFGSLFLNGGIWKNERVISQNWIDISTQKYIEPGRFQADSSWADGYAFQWWLWEDIYDIEFSAYFASGWGGQWIIVSPPSALVVVTTGGNYYTKEAISIQSILINYIIPSISE